MVLDLLRCIARDGRGRRGGLKNDEFGCYANIEWSLFLDLLG